jgi:lysozyme
MNSEILSQFEQMLIQQEGLRLKLYICPTGKMTIGCGRNLEDLGISEEEALFLLKNDINRVLKEVSQFKWIDSLNAPRQLVILSMVFNLGLSKFLQFKKLIQAIQDKNYDLASNEMLSSLWASQVKKRAVILAEIMKTGQP